MVKQRASKFWGLLYSSFYLLHSLLYHDKASRIAIVVFWCFVFCTPHQNTRVHYYYCCWKVFHSLLDAATIPATARAFFFVSVCSMYAFFIIIIRCYRTFSLAHTHPEKWRDDFSFGLLFFFLFCSSSLFFFSSTVAIVHNWLYFTPYDISRSSVLCIFHVEYWTLNRWKCAESVATCCGNRIEHSVRERAFAQTHVWKFNLHSFRFVDFLTFISICPTMSLSICLLSMPRALKRFRKISIGYAVCWCYKHLRLPISIGSPFLVPAHTPPLLSYSSSASSRSKRRKGTKITKRWIAQSEIYRQTTAEFSSTAVINYCVPICSEAVYRFLSFAIVCCRFAIYSGLFIKMYNDLFGPSHSTA